MHALTQQLQTGLIALCSSVGWLSRITALLSVALFTAWLPATVPADETAQTSPKETARLIAVLTSDASVFEKAKACQRLAVVGDESSVPALSALLPDDKLSNYARQGLEAIPSSAADAALRDALDRLDGNLLIGVINSLGNRRCAEAEGALKILLSHDNVAVAEAAARALGFIGSPAAAEILQHALGKSSTARRPALAKASLICGQRLVQQDREGAVKLLDTVRNAKLPKHLILAATHSAIIARGDDAVPLLAEQLDSDDDERFRVALQAARYLDIDVSPQFVERFDKLPPERQAMLLIALGDLGNSGSLPTITKAAASGMPEVRVQAIRVLGRLGDATAAAVLLDAALDPNARIAQAAQSSLDQLPGEKVDDAVVAMLESRDADRLRVAIDLSSRRGIAAAAPALWKLSDSPTAAIRSAAVKALGSTIGLEDLPKLLAKTAAAYTPEEIAVARQATRAACVRMPRDKCAALLAGGLAGANADRTAFLLEQLALVGGPTALEAVVAAARSDDEAAQDAATRVLGEWLTADAAPAMFALAKSLNGKYKIRALRGYVRIARQLDMPVGQRMDVCRNTLQIAERDDEKKLVLDVLRRHPAPDGLAIAASLLTDARLKEQACVTIVAVADKVISTSSAEAETALKQVLQTTRNPDVMQRAKQLIASTPRPSEPR